MYTFEVSFGVQQHFEKKQTTTILKNIIKNNRKARTGEGGMRPVNTRALPMPPRGEDRKSQVRQRSLPPKLTHVLGEIGGGGGGGEAGPHGGGPPQRRAAGGGGFF